MVTFCSVSVNQKCHFKLSLKTKRMISKKFIMTMFSIPEEPEKVRKEVQKEFQTKRQKQILAGPEKVRGKEVEKEFQPRLIKPLQLCRQVNH